jgi:hypothetical protein
MDGRSVATLPTSSTASQPGPACDPRPIRRLVILLTLLVTLAASATAEARVLVRYDVAGGLSGMGERLTVDSERTARQTGKRAGNHRFRLSAKEFRALKRELKAAHFGSLRRFYGPTRIVNDGITQTVAYKGHLVSVSTGGDPPARLERVLRRLGRLMRR